VKLNILSSDEVKYVWSYTTTSPYFFKEWCLIKPQESLFHYISLLDDAFQRDMDKNSYALPEFKFKY
jgi:hypothetical protein